MTWCNRLNLSRSLQLAVAIASVANVCSTCSLAPARDRWTKAEAQSWYHDQPRLFGANYVMTYAVTPTEMWQADTSVPDANTFDINAIRSEFDIAQQTGFNTLRTTLSYEVWKADRDGFMNRLEQVIDAAAVRGIRPTLIFWDDVNFTHNENVPFREPYLGPQADPVPGMHNSQWTGTGGAAVRDNSANWELPRTSSEPGAGAKEYIQEIIGTYANDNRVLMWNCFNEPGGASGGLVHATADWAREMDPIQPISFDVWGGIDNTAMSESDVISYHNYSGPPGVTNGVKQMLATGRPVFLTEWMARTFGSTIPDVLPDLQELGVASYNWGLVNGDQQTHWPWGSPPQTETTEPPLWFHDLYRRDGTPYKPEEIQLYQHYRLQDTVLRSADSRLVAIENPSFEADDLGGVPDAHTDRQFQGWSIIHESGDWVGGTIVPDTWHFTEPVPDGTQAMFAVDIEIGQVLNETLQAGTYYVLQVDVGHRVQRTLPEYDINLYAGGVELAPLTVGLSNPVEGQWTDASKIYQVADGDPLAGSQLEIRLSSPGYETFFDNVRLIAVDSLQEIGQTSDLNLDGVVTVADWRLFITNSYADLSGYSPAQKFLHGDLDRDGDNDFDDFRIFKSDFIAANGETAFEALLVTPEPASIVLALLASLFVPTMLRARESTAVRRVERSIDVANCGRQAGM
jgi:HpiC1 cyclase/Cellulase (glycosyl hydrolase family 5)